MNRSRTLSLAVIAAALWLAGRAVAADTGVVSREAIEAALQKEPQIKTRGLKVQARSEESRGEESQGAIDLQIAFALSSATLLPEARSQLKELADALKSARLAEQSFELAGHTDASGRAGYNRSLSEARAAAVRDYLAAAGVDAARLSVAGYGSDRPLAGKAPGDPANRRVEVRVRETSP